MKALKITSWYNNLHFLLPPLILIPYIFKYKILLFLLIPYLIYVFKRNIFKRAILLITIITSVVYIIYNTYTPKIKEFEGMILEENTNKYIASNGLYSILFYSDVDYEIGDIVIVNGDKSTPSKESYLGGFSYYDYLKSKGVYYIYKEPNIKKKNHIIIPGQIREKCINYLEGRLDEDSVNYINALIFGKNTIDDTTKETISSLGLSHLFAISGFHITLLFTILSFLLAKIIENERIRNNIIITFLIFYILFTNLQISIIRASLMIIFSILNKRYNKLFTSLDIFSLAMIISLIINPGYVYQTSFKLTYLITFFIIISNNLIKGRGKAYKIGLIAFLGGLPIVINMNYSINLLQILLVPIFSAVISVLIPYLGLMIIIPMISKIGIIKMFERLIEIIGDIDFLTIKFKYINIYFIIIYYILFLLLLIFIEAGKKKKRYYVGFISYIIFLSALRFSSFSYQIEFIDVGQGDTALITLPHNKGVIMVDTFGYNTAYLKNRGIETIDYLIITHSDNDHIGGIDETLKEFRVKRVISSYYDKINYESYPVKSGDKINIEGITLNVLGPIKDAGSKNDNSIVFMMNILGTKILFTGDMEASEEESLVSKYGGMLDADILKVGHHGSSTSSTKEFIACVSPKYSIISCGLNNKYGFPHQSVIANLYKSKIYRTDLMGNISVKISANKIDIHGYK